MGTLRCKNVAGVARCPVHEVSNAFRDGTNVGSRPKQHVHLLHSMIASHAISEIMSKHYFELQKKDMESALTSKTKVTVVVQAMHHTLTIAA
jgi:hypothetical protein